MGAQHVVRGGDAGGAGERKGGPCSFVGNNTRAGVRSVVLGSLGLVHVALLRGRQARTPFRGSNSYWGWETCTARRRTIGGGPE